MTKRIFRSVLLAAAAVLLACIVLIMGALYDYFGAVQKKQLREELALAASAVEQGGVGYLETLGGETCRLTYVSADGTVLFDTNASADTLENHAAREEIREALNSGYGESARYSATLLERTVYCAKRLSDGTVLRASVSRATVPSLVVGMLQPILLVLLAALILSAFLARRLSKRIVEPLNALDLEHPLENNVYDELSPMLTHIEMQRRRIDGQVAELKKKQDEFSAVVRNMNEGLVLLNRAGEILSINAAAAAFLSTDEGCVGEDFLAVDRTHEIDRAIRAATEEGHSEIRIDRGGRAYQLGVSRIDANGGEAGVALLIFDVTDKVFAERNRREFTANVSHELKTPLQSIMGSAELLENRLVKAEDVPRFVGQIRSEAARLVSLIEDIIRLSQLDEQTELPTESVDLYALAKEEIAPLARQAEEKRVTLSLTGAPVTVSGVRRLLSEILVNLCGNAIKYNVEGGSVTVTVRDGGENAILTVADTGIGIPEEAQPRVFERFYRVDKSRSKETGGTGLGLSIVKHAVQAMGGEIRLESTPGNGSTFTVILPKMKK